MADAGDKNSSRRQGWYFNATSNRLEMWFKGAGAGGPSVSVMAGYINASGIFTAAAAAVGSTADDVLFTLGTGTDVSQVLRSTILNANTVLTGALVGTPVTPAIAAKSLLVANKTASGDMLFAINNGGNSQALLKLAGSSGIASLYYQGVAALNTASGGIGLPGKITNYNGVATAGIGTAPIYGAAKQTAVTTTANNNVLTVTPAAATGTYRVSVAATVTSATSGVVSFTVSYKDAAGATVTTQTIPLNQLNSATVSVAVTTSAASRYYGTVDIDVDNSATNIVVAWVGGGTIAGFVSASIEQLN